MKLITKNTDYAMRALCAMAGTRDKKIYSVSELSERLNIPRPYLRRIFQTLHKKKILKAHKGKGGGFTLAKPAEKIFVFDLIKIFQGQFKLNNCILKKNICPEMNTCMLRRKIEQIERYALSTLKSVTIKSLLDGSENGEKRIYNAGLSE